MGSQVLRKEGIGDGTTFSPTEATGTVAITVKNSFTVIDLVTTKATGNRTINLTVDANVRKGDTILVQMKTNDTETHTFGTGFTVPTVTGVAGKTKNQLCVYNGSSFTAVAAAVQID